MKVGSPFNLRDIDCMDFATAPQRDGTLAFLGTGGATPQNLVDDANNGGQNATRAVEGTAAPYVQTLDPTDQPTDVPTGGNDHHC